MPAWSWRTTSAGFVEVDQGAGFARLELEEGDRHVPRVERWTELARAAAKRERAPLSWVLGVIYAESGGNPRAGCGGPATPRVCPGERPCGDLGCWGLMQIHAGVFRDHSPEEWLDPATNIGQGAKLLGSFRAAGHDLPASSSMYNAGPSRLTGGPKASASDPWGYVEDMGDPWGYIERVVRASNTFRARLGESDASSASSGGLFLALGAAGLLAAAASKRWI